MAVDVDVFKAGMRRLAASVCLITTQLQDGRRVGMTATAVCSVAAVPPLLLCCINRENASFSAVRDAGTFAVNALAVDDQPLADRFARRIPQEQKFAEGLWMRLETGAPILETALAAFDCRLRSITEAGTHGIMLGEIVAIRIRHTDVKPLLYACGGYGGFASISASADSNGLWIPAWGFEE